MAVESPHLQGAAGQWGHRQNHDGDGYPEAHLHSENIGSKEKAQPAAEPERDRWRTAGARAAEGSQKHLLLMQNNKGSIVQLWTLPWFQP